MKNIGVLALVLVAWGACGQEPGANLTGQQIVALVSGNTLLWTDSRPNTERVTFRYYFNIDGSGNFGVKWRIADIPKVKPIKWNIEGDKLCMNNPGSYRNYTKCAYVEQTNTGVFIDLFGTPLYFSEVVEGDHTADMAPQGELIPARIAGTIR